MLTSCTRAVVEGMTMSASSEYRREAYTDLAATILALILSVVLIAAVGQWLWNNVLIELFTFCRPSRSIWMLLGLKVFILLMLP